MMRPHDDSRSFGSFRPIPGHDPDAVIEQELSRPVAAPDLTRSIMGRLGYMQAAPAVVKRQRQRLWLNRAALTAVLAAVASIGMVMLSNSPDARRPVDATIPSAISSDLQQSRERVNSVIQLLRELPRLEVEVIEPIDPNSAPAEDGSPHLLDEDVDRSAVAPVRWV